MPRNKRGVYVRPEGWEKTILHREGSDEDYEGVKFKDYKSEDEKKRKKAGAEAKKGRFGGLLSRIVSGE